MIEILRPGQYSTIQDLGRLGYRSVGVPVSGPMDSASALQANCLLGNEPNDALIEMAYVGASFLFQKPAIIAFSGADCEVKLNNEIVESQSVLCISAGSTLSFGALKLGNFLYLAIAGGFKSEKVLGSASYFQSITEHARISKGMILSFDESSQKRKVKQSEKLTSIKASSYLEVEKGPEFHLLSDEKIRLLTEMEFTISTQSNRMGFRLNEQIGSELDEIISSPVQPGTVQLTQGGQLIVLMRDAQTIGGYPRILQLTEESINQLAQCNRSSRMMFRLVG